MASMQNYKISQCSPIDDFGAIGDWLHESGWVQALVQADIATVGLADSLYRATHVTFTRKAHQNGNLHVSCCLVQSATPCHDHYALTSEQNGQTPVDFEVWCDERKGSSPQFQYWETAATLEVCTLIYVWSLREPDFAMYL